MDQVLANFDLEIKRRFGRSFEYLGDTAQDRWDLIGTNCHELYAHLESMPDADELVSGVLEFCSRRNLRVGVLTAIPTLLPLQEAVQHKKDWIRARYPELLPCFNIGPLSRDKQKFARLGDILIDDRPLNILQWDIAGGIGIQHFTAEQTLYKLNNL
jgi:hypothetical protein